MSQKTSKTTSKGEAFERILLTMVAHAPVLASRADLIDSPSLIASHRNSQVNPEGLHESEAKDYEPLTESEIRNAAKALGRMVASGAIKEVLIPNGHDARVNLPESGLIAVSISLPTLQTLRKKWEGAKLKVGDKPSQETIAREIRTKSINWIISSCDDHGIPLFLNDVWIVHGSNSIDMLVQVSYRSSQQFMHYVRDVIQEIEGVLSTQTMQISNDLAKNDIHKKQ